MTPNPQLLGLTEDQLAAIEAVDITEWAHFYLRVGLTPLPKALGRKHPSVDWKPYETTAPTADDIDRLFAYEADGICLVIDGTDFIVLDFDGPQDRATLLLKDAGIEIPPACPRVVTGRGQHFYFRTPHPVGRHVGLLKGDGVQLDVLGAGCVVARPSIHPDTGTPYRWAPPFVSPDLVPPLPERVSQLIADATRPRQLPLRPVDGAIVKGERERTLTSLLGAARRRGAVEPELPALADAVNTRCEPPLSGRDLDRLAQSIARYQPDDLDVNRLVASVAVAKVTAAPTLDFVTPAELQATGEARVDYVLRPYLIGGTLTDLTGAAKIGKSRLRNYFIRCAITGSRCLGHPAMPAVKVVLLTEEPPAAILEGLEAAGLMATRALSILTRHAARGTDWPSIVAAAMATVCDIDARLLIVDTLPGVAQLQGDAENSAGHVLAALRPLQEADAPALARLVIRHTRKMGGGVVEGGRGSSAFAGEADMLIRMTRPRGARRSIRQLDAIGRFAAIPAVTLIEQFEHSGNAATPGDQALPELIETYRIVHADAVNTPDTTSVAARVVQALRAGGTIRVRRGQPDQDASPQCPSCPQPASRTDPPNRRRDAW